MNAKSTAYEVCFSITKYRRIVVFAENRQEAIEKAQRLHAIEPYSDLFEIAYDTDESWYADEVEP